MTNERTSENHVDDESPRFHSTTVDLKDRLCRGEHLAVVQDYLEGRLRYSPSDWYVASLVGLAMRHHFAELERQGKLVVGFVAEQIDDGLAITIDWPKDPAIDVVDVSLELTDATGESTLIARQFQRVSSASATAGSVFGRTLASNQTVVLRPLRSAVEIRATVKPSHRLRFDETELAPELRACAPPEEAIPHHDIQFRPVEIVERTHIDIYREAQGREVLELVTPQEQRERAQRARALRRKKKVRRAIKVTAAVAIFLAVLVGVLVLVHRFVTPLPDWIPLIPGEGVLDGTPVRVSDGF